MPARRAAAAAAMTVMAMAAVEWLLPIVERTMAAWGSEVPYYALSSADMLRLPARAAWVLTMAWAVAAVASAAAGAGGGS
ncbi:MAG: hypothetical protein DYG90_12890, partial [Chloroflexi bacterium CFX6]|nr:hypothetical protein [Chloroflexi bacterium CFX6]